MINKGRRNELKQLKYKKRIRKYAASCHLYIDSNGNHIDDPKTIDIINDNGLYGYKNTSTLCSCLGCSGLRYDRKEFKKETRRLIDDFYDTNEEVL